MWSQLLDSGANLSLHVSPLFPGTVRAEKGRLSSGHSLSRLERGVHLDPGGSSLLPPTGHAPCWVGSSPGSGVEGGGTSALVGGN